MAQLPADWRPRLVALSVACLMVPLTAIWLPRFMLFEAAGLVNNRFALAVPGFMGTSPFYVAVYNVLDGNEANPRIKLFETFAASVAALQTGAYVPRPGEKICLIVCGANVDPATLG